MSNVPKIMNTLYKGNDGSKGTWDDNIMFVFKFAALPSKSCSTYHSSYVHNFNYLKYGGETSHGTR